MPETEGEVGTVKHVIIFADCFKAVLLMWIFFDVHICLCYAVLIVPCSLVITCWERANLLALLCFVFLCFVTFPYGVNVSRVRCGT